MLGSFSLALLGTLVHSAPGAGPAPAAAPFTEEDRARVRILYQDGKTLFNAGQYEAAIEAFQAAYDLSGDDTFLFNIGLARDRMGDLEGAIEALDQYRSSLPVSDREPLDQRIRGLKIRIAARDAKPTEEPTEKPPIEGALSEPAPPPPVVVDCPDPVLPPSAPRRDDQRVMTPAAIALTATTGATLVAGAVLGGISLAAQRDADAQCVDAGGSRRCLDDAAADLRRSRRTAVAADVTLAVGAGLAIGTIALIATNAVKRRRARAFATVSGAFVRF